VQTDSLHCRDLESPPRERREFRFLVTGVAIGPYF
jgi:hypothetical protein